MYSFGINSVVYKIKFDEMMRLNTNANFAFLSRLRNVNKKNNLGLIRCQVAQPSAMQLLL